MLSTQNSMCKQYNTYKSKSKIRGGARANATDSRRVFEYGGYVFESRPVNFEHGSLCSLRCVRGRWRPTHHATSVRRVGARRYGAVSAYSRGESEFVSSSHAFVRSYYTFQTGRSRVSRSIQTRRFFHHVFRGKSARARTDGRTMRRSRRNAGRAPKTSSMTWDDDDDAMYMSLEDGTTTTTGMTTMTEGDEDVFGSRARRTTTRARTRAATERRRRRRGDADEEEERVVVMMDTDIVVVDSDAMDAGDVGDDGVDRLSALPRDVVVEIVRRLESERDVAAAAMTCTAFWSATRCEGVWRNLLASKLGAEAAVVLPKRLSEEVVHPSSPRGAWSCGRVDFEDGEKTTTTTTTTTTMMDKCQRRDVSSAVWETPKWMLKYQRWHNPTKGTLTWSASTTEESLEPAETKYAARYLHRCTAVGDKSKILFFGGQGHGSDFYNDLHVLDLDAKELRLKQLYAKSSQEPPFPRCSGTLTSMAVTGMPNSEVVALFGGSQGFFEGFSNSLLILCADDGVLRVSDAATDGGGLTWHEPIIRANPLNPEGRIPAARWGHSAVALNGKLILFGGSNTTHCFNDTWLLELVLEEGRLVAVWTLLLDGERSAAPPPRAGQTACLVKSCLYIFGGCHVSEVFNDVWKLDLTAPGGFLRWEEFKCQGTPPSPRVGHAAVVLGDRIILSGGRGSATRGAIGKYATDKDSLASMQGLTFFQSGFAMLDTSSRKWLPIQHAVMEDTDGDTNSCDRVTHVREHRTGHAMMPARNGCLLLIGGLGYDGVFQNDLSLVSMF